MCLGPVLDWMLEMMAVGEVGGGLRNSREKTNAADDDDDAAAAA